MSKFYQHTLPQAFHLSVGAVLFNDKMEICTHHFIEKYHPKELKYLLGGLDDAYHLVRESLEGDESLQSAVLRGVYEEFGAKGVVEKYLGPLTCTVKTPTKAFQKLTLYHSVRLTELGERPDIDEESHSEMEWYAPKELLDLYKKQATLTDREELNEVEVIRRFIEAYEIE